MIRLEMNASTDNELTARTDNSRLALCNEVVCDCCVYLKFFTLYAHFVPAGTACPEEDDWSGDSNILQWGPVGDCDTWEYLAPTLDPPNVMQCFEAPSTPAIEVDHWIWLRCNDENEFTADVCFDTGVPATPTTSNCDENYNDNPPIFIDLVCRNPNDATQPGYLTVDFGIIQYSLCDPTGDCGFRLIISTAPTVGDPTDDCDNCDAGTTPEELDIEIADIANDGCGACTSVNGTYTCTKLPSQECCWEKDLGFFCGVDWYILICASASATQYFLIWTIYKDGVPFKQGTATYGSKPDCEDTVIIGVTSDFGEVTNCDTDSMTVELNP